MPHQPTSISTLAVPLQFSIVTVCDRLTCSRTMRRVAVLAVSLVLSSCSSPPPQPHAHDPLTWSAAIGRLDDNRDGSSCSATLVAPDVIATAAHCVILDGKAVDATALTFNPNLGAAPLPPSQGVKIIAIGKDTKSPERGDNLDPATDWALVRIAPPVTAVAPIPVGTFTAADIDDKLAKGGDLLQAGYGVYGLELGQHLYQQGHCRRLNDDKLADNLRDYILYTSCRPIKGDSGGPLLLADSNGMHFLVGVISQYRFTQGAADRVTVAAGALGFVRHVASVD